MKKSAIISALSVAFLLASCGGGDEKEGGKDSACKTGNGVAIDCKDADNYKKIGELNKKFELTFPKNKEEYEAFIATNEVVLKEIEPLWASMENIVKADPGIAEQQHYTRTLGYIEDVEKYKSVLADLGNITITGSQEGGMIMLNVKSGSSKAIKKIRGNMQYLDAEGNVVCEKEYEITANDLEVPAGIPAGFDGITDKGIYCKDTDKVSSVNFVASGLDYIEEAE